MLRAAAGPFSSSASMGRQLLLHQTLAELELVLAVLQRQRIRLGWTSSSFPGAAAAVQVRARWVMHRAGMPSIASASLLAAATWLLLAAAHSAAALMARTIVLAAGGAPYLLQQGLPRVGLLGKGATHADD